MSNSHHDNMNNGGSRSHERKARSKVTHFFVYSIFVGILLILFGVSIKDGGKAIDFAEFLNQLGSGILAAGAVGIVFEYIASRDLIWNATNNLINTLNNASREQKVLLETLEGRVNRVGEEIVMSSGMLKNATSVGIQAVYNGREPTFHQEVAHSIRNSKDSVRIVGISLADLCGYWGGKSEAHEAVEEVMGKDNLKVQILFSDPEGEGLKIRAKYEHPGIAYEDTRAYKQTVEKITETVTIAEKDILEGRVEVKLYDATPSCFLVLTDGLVFIEQYTYAGRGGSNVLFAIKNNTPLYRLHADHFEALWRDARDATEYSSGLMSNINKNNT